MAIHISVRVLILMGMIAGIVDLFCDEHVGDDLDVCARGMDMFARAPRGREPSTPPHSSWAGMHN